MSEKFDALKEIIARLRNPDGCPWDREQTHRTLRHNLVEEVYELVDAVEQDDNGKIREELGDALMLLVFHARIAEEDGAFTIDDVIAGISEKLIRRHPHVFGDVKTDSVDQITANWHRIKQEEKQRGSILDGIPRHLPALARAYKFQKRAARVGFDWEKLEDVFGKLDEEVTELKQELESGSKDRIEDEMGDALFALVNIARFLDVHPEEALTRTTAKFERRFRYIEKQLKEQGRDISTVGLAAMDELWNEAKKQPPQ